MKGNIKNLALFSGCHGRDTVSSKQKIKRIETIKKRIKKKNNMLYFEVRKVINKAKIS